MVRISALVLVFAVVMTGCKKRPEQPAASDAEQRKAMEDYARKKIPVLDRTIVQQEMQQIFLAIRAAASATGKWPKNLNAMREELNRDLDMRKLMQKVDDGTYVLVENPPDGGIVMYCSKETTVGLIAMNMSGEFSQHRPDDLKKILTEQRR